MRLSYIGRHISRITDTVGFPNYDTNVMFFMFPYADHFKDLPKWDGEIIRNGTRGFSGTHQSIVLMSEELVRRNYTVWVACGTCNETTVNGVKYVNSANIQKIVEQIHILVITPWTSSTIGSYNWLSLKKLVLWFHLKEEYSIGELIRYFYITYKKCKFYCNFITGFVSDYFIRYNSHLKFFFENRCGNIRNPILLDMAHEVTEKISRSFIFHASFERGGAFSCKIYDGLNFPDKSMTICSYVDHDIANADGYRIGTKNKRDLFETLAKTEYFIYPGVCSKKFMLTKETDSCVVAEALLHEVIVLAFPVGALPENYRDNVIWIPFPSNANISSINDPKDTFEPELVSEEVINSIQQIIYELDANPSRKEDIRKRGKQHVKDQRNLTLITNQFLNLLNQQ